MRVFVYAGRRNAGRAGRVDFGCYAVTGPHLGRSVGY